MPVLNQKLFVTFQENVWQLKIVGLIVTALAVFPASQFCLDFKLDMTPGRQ